MPGVALLVEELRLDRRAEEEATHGDHADERATAQQANRGCLGCVTQRPEAHEGANDEVAVGHADLKAALPRLQALAVESEIRKELLGEPAVRDDGLDLVSREGLLAP